MDMNTAVQLLRIRGVEPTQDKIDAIMCEHQEIKRVFAGKSLDVPEFNGVPIKT